MRQPRILVFLVLLSAAVGRLAAAQEAPPEALVVTAENLMAGDERHEAWVEKGGSATDVLPGDVIRYALRFTNTQAEPVRKLAAASISWRLNSGSS